MNRADLSRKNLALRAGSPRYIYVTRADNITFLFRCDSICVREVNEKKLKNFTLGGGLDWTAAFPHFDICTIVTFSPATTPDLD